MKLVNSIFYLETDEFKKIKICLAYIMARTDNNEIFFSYCYNKGTTNLLYCTQGNRIPNLFMEQRSKDTTVRS